MSPKSPRQSIFIPCLLFFFILLPSIAHADIIWPAAILEDRILAWWAILFGLIVEVLVVRWMTSMKPLRCLIATVAMNAASTIAGIVLIPLGGILIEIFPGMIIYPIFNLGTFNPFTWALTVIVAAAINSGIEILVLRRFTSTVSKKTMFGGLFVANLISVALAAGSMIIWPVKGL